MAVDAVTSHATRLDGAPFWYESDTCRVRDRPILQHSLSHLRTCRFPDSNKLRKEISNDCRLTSQRMLLVRNSRANLLLVKGATSSNKRCGQQLMDLFHYSSIQSKSNYYTTRYSNISHHQHNFFSDGTTKQSYTEDNEGSSGFRNPTRTNNSVKFGNSCVHTDVKVKYGNSSATRALRTEGRKVTSLSLSHKKRQGQKITMVTAYDYPSALHVDRANVDVLLVGDSCAMVELGYDTTQPLTMEEILHHCRAVRRGAPNGPLLVGDLPLGSYEVNDQDALMNSYRFIKEAGMDAVKLEGGSKARARTVQTIVEGGVAVMGHIGLTPQAISVIGGFRAQGRTAIRVRCVHVTCHSFYLYSHHSLVLWYP